ncbi:MAG TPA: peptidoglycan DD-metalloendopeptidase family protein [Polyangiales bacterium]|nr:peptidoglycan DD-metalloendopeptidase family protein [Polyangiales bacterium]
MVHDCRFLLARWLGRAALLAVCGAAASWMWLQLDRRTLPGLRVAGDALPRTSDPLPLLVARAKRWGEQQLSITTGPHLTRASRAQLGAHLEAAGIARQAQRVGRSGNPLVDVWTALDTLRHGRDLRWTPRVDRAQLGRYVRAIRNAVERPPLAGSRDSTGWSIPGVAGSTLDTVAAAAVIEGALLRGELQVSQPLREVSPPQAILIGSPDAFLYADDEQSDPFEVPRGAEISDAKLLAARPRYWLPSQGRECMDPPYERFCQGPRRVALPFGAAADLAERLELGTLQCVGQLLNHPPRAEWVRAAGGPLPRRATLTWPAAHGRLWRRFGYVRKPPFENLLHRGIDVGAPRGSPVIATNPGVVAYSDNGVRGYGNLLVIVHDDASVTLSAHCQAIYVFPGQRVSAGQIVGEVGETGMARGAHVHFEYRYAGEPTDPLRFL